MDLAGFWRILGVIPRLIDLRFRLSPETSPNHAKGLVFVKPPSKALARD